MAGFTSISPHTSASSLHPKFHSSTLAYNFNSSIESTGTKVGKLSRSFRPLRIQNVATKPAKSPGR